MYENKSTIIFVKAIDKIVLKIHNCSCPLQNIFLLLILFLFFLNIYKKSLKSHNYSHIERSTKYILKKNEVLKNCHQGLSLKILKNSPIVNIEVPKKQD